MSFVEKALEKIKSAAADGMPSAHSRSAVRVSGSLPDGATRMSARAEFELRPMGTDPSVAERPRRIVHISEADLRAAGILPPEADSRRSADEYRAIKRAVIDDVFAAQSTGTREAHLVAVSSALPGDGKTHTSVNLALSLAMEKDHAVVLVDADVAKPHVSRLLGVAEEPGLLDVLATREVSLRSVLLPTDRPNLWILPAGSRSEIASELLASQRMREVCASLVGLMPQAVILLDAPPLLVTSEAPVLVSVAGQIVLVVKAGVTPQAAVLDAIAKIGNRERLKLVLNQAEDSGLASYYDGRWHRYGSAYEKESAKPRD